MRATSPTVPRISDLTSVPELRSLLVSNAVRGFRAQLVVRALLVVFAGLAVAFVPPPNGKMALHLIVVGYAAWAGLVYVAVRFFPERVLGLSWMALYGDVAGVTALVAVASTLPGDGRLAEALLWGMFVIPILAAGQLRRLAAVTVLVPTVVAFAACAFPALGGDVTALRETTVITTTLLASCVGSVLLVRVQQTRVLSLSQGLTRQRELLAQLLTAEDRERSELAVRLHDGALQYLLAARQDVEDLPPGVPSDVRERLRTAVDESAALLRSEVSDLHPAVLTHAGLVAALERLATEATARGATAFAVDASRWDDGGAPAAQRLLFDTARELIANVDRHSGATHATITLSVEDDVDVLVVADDGRGVSAEVLSSRQAEGHIGLPSRRLRLETAGGALLIRPAPGGGLEVRASLPREG